MPDMGTSWFKKLLAFLILVSLVFGPGTTGAVAAMAMTNHDSPTAVATDQQTDNPCAHHAKPAPDKVKKTTCADACQATSQATIPALETVPVRYAVRLAFDRTSHVAPDRTGPPDSPPPRP